ncbi:MAG: RidA family protein [Burkholderiaceae bacterium]
MNDKRHVASPEAADWGDLPYCQAAISNGFLFISGQLGMDKKTGKPAEGIRAQAESILTQIKGILAAAGCSLDDVVQTTCYLVDRARDYDGFNEVYKKYFDDPARYPARATVEVKGLAPGYVLEIQAIARCTAS